VQLPPRDETKPLSEEDVRNILSRYRRDESGATAIEYALIAGSIGLVIITAAQLIGGSLVTVFTNVSTGFPA
jgi:pilus assembly protein Flp/PilA